MSVIDNILPRPAFGTVKGFASVSIVGLLQHGQPKEGQVDERPISPSRNGGSTAGRARGRHPHRFGLVHGGTIIGRGHDHRVQRGSAIPARRKWMRWRTLGHQPASVYRECILYTTLSPCSMCFAGAILLYGVPRVIIGENQTFMGERNFFVLGAFRSKSYRMRSASLDEGIHPAQPQTLERGYWRLTLRYHA